MLDIIMQWPLRLILKLEKERRWKSSA